MRSNPSFAITPRSTLARSCSIYVSNGGARGVMVIVTGYGHGDTSSIPGQD